MPRRWATAEIPDQSGRRYVVTGANSGIGLACAGALARAGARIVLAVRDLAKGEQAAATIAGAVEVLHIDLADLASVAAFADRVGPVDVLVNNAGVMGTPFLRTVDGFELQLGTNHLGHFALTNLLLPRLTDRVVVVGSVAHRSARIDVDDLCFQHRRYTPYGAYAQSKLANLLHLAELQRRLAAAGSPVRATGAHPGYAATGITRHTGSRAFTRLGEWGGRLVAMSAAQGALSPLYAATMDLPGGSYVGPDRFGGLRGGPAPAARSHRALDPDLARALWARSEELTGTRFPQIR